MTDKLLKSWQNIYGLNTEKEAEEIIKRVINDTIKAHAMVDDFPDIDWNKCKGCICVDLGLRGCYWNFQDCEKHYVPADRKVKK